MLLDVQTAADVSEEEGGGRGGGGGYRMTYIICSMKHVVGLQAVG